MKLQEHRPSGHELVGWVYRDIYLEAHMWSTDFTTLQLCMGLSLYFAAVPADC